MPNQIAESISALICHKDTQTPLTIGVLGEWGSGKTSLMSMIRSKIAEKRDKVQLAGKPVWFDAWRHNNDQNLRQAFLWNIASQLEAGLWWGEIFFKRFIYLIKKTQKPQAIFLLSFLSLLAYFIVSGLLDSQQDFSLYLKNSNKKWPLAVLLLLNPKAIPQFVRWIFRLVPATHFSHLIGGRNWRGEVQNIELVRSDIETMISSYLNKNERLIIFIDDLDRCSPESATKILEAVNVLVDFKDCIFILGMDYEKIALLIGKKYESAVGYEKQCIDEIGHRYLEKIIQLPIKLPPWAPSSIEAFTGQLINYDNSAKTNKEAGTAKKKSIFKDLKYTDEWKKFLIEATSMLTAPTPRSLKRFVAQANFFYFFCERLRDDNYNPFVFVYLMVVQKEYPDELELSEEGQVDDEKLRQLIPELNRKISNKISFNDHLTFLVLSETVEDQDSPEKDIELTKIKNEKTDEVKENENK